jgi:hypothetical protein
LTALLLAINALIPDPVPFVDELVTALLALLFASWRKSRTES